MSASDPYDVEMEMLRDFYVQWNNFHAIPRDKLHRRKHEVAAQNLVDASHALKAFYRAHEYRDPFAELHD